MPLRFSTCFEQTHLISNSCFAKYIVGNRSFLRSHRRRHDLQPINVSRRDPKEATVDDSSTVASFQENLRSQRVRLYMIHRGKSSLICGFLAQRPPNSLRREGQLTNAHAGRVEDGAGHGRRHAVHGDLGHGLGPVGTAGLVGLDQDRLQLRHLVGGEDAVVAEARVEQTARSRRRPSPRRPHSPAPGPCRPRPGRWPSAG